MTTVDTPDVEVAPPPLKTLPRRSTGWLTRFLPRTKIGFDGDKDPFERLLIYRKQMTKELEIYDMQIVD